VLLPLYRLLLTLGAALQVRRPGLPCPHTLACSRYLKLQLLGLCGDSLNGILLHNVFVGFALVSISPSSPLGTVYGVFCSSSERCSVSRPSMHWSMAAWRPASASPPITERVVLLFKYLRRERRVIKDR
jgi:hypothetical protein